MIARPALASRRTYHTSQVRTEWVRHQPRPLRHCRARPCFIIRAGRQFHSSTRTVAGWTIQPMSNVGSGRTPGESLWRANGINVFGEPNLLFLFTDNQGNFDNPFGPGTNYETPLDAFVVKDGQIYNYWPPPSVSSNRVET